MSLEKRRKADQRLWIVPGVVAVAGMPQVIELGDKTLNWRPAMARVEDIPRTCDVRLLRAGREVGRTRDNCRAIEDYWTAMMRGANGGGTLKGDATVHAPYQPSAGISVRRGT